MSSPGQPGAPDGPLPVVGPGRPLVRRAVFSTVFAAAVFFVFTVPTKQFGPLYAHAPWENDPYDTVYSFAMFFVPLVTGCFLVQVSLCRRCEPLLTSRALAIVRGCRVAVAVISATLASCWASLAVGANRTHWTALGTGVLVALLVVTTALTGRAVVHLASVPKLKGTGPVAGQLPAEWLADAVVAAQRESHWLGPVRPLGLRALGWADGTLLVLVRRHPLVSAGLAAAGFGLLLGVNQGIREGYFLSVTALASALLSCGMFAFLVLAGSYLGIVRSSTHLSGVQRRVVDATVAACTAAVGALALRDLLWWVVGSNSVMAGPVQLTMLVGLAALTAFALVFAVESMLRCHPA